MPSSSLVIGIATTFPCQLFVAADILETRLWPPHVAVALGPAGARSRQRLLRTFMVLVASVIAIGVPQFGPLVGFIGALGSSSLQFIFPPLLYLRLFGWHRVSPRKRCLLVSYMAVGVIAAGLGSAQAINEMSKNQ